MKINSHCLGPQISFWVYSTSINEIKNVDNYQSLLYEAKEYPLHSSTDGNNTQRNLAELIDGFQKCHRTGTSSLAVFTWLLHKAYKEIQPTKSCWDESLSALEEIFHASCKYLELYDVPETDHINSQKSISTDKEELEDVSWFFTDEDNPIESSHETPMESKDEHILITPQLSNAMETNPHTVDVTEKADNDDLDTIIGLQHSLVSEFNLQPSDSPLAYPMRLAYETALHLWGSHATMDTNQPTKLRHTMNSIHSNKDDTTHPPWILHSRFRNSLRRVQMVTMSGKPTPTSSSSPPSVVKEGIILPIPSKAWESAISVSRHNHHGCGGDTAAAVSHPTFSRIVICHSGMVVSGSPSNSFTMGDSIQAQQLQVTQIHNEVRDTDKNPYCTSIQLLQQYKVGLVLCPTTTAHGTSEMGIWYDACLEFLHSIPSISSSHDEFISGMAMLPIPYDWVEDISRLSGASPIDSWSELCEEVIGNHVMECSLVTTIDHRPVDITRLDAHEGSDVDTMTEYHAADYLVALRRLPLKMEKLDDWDRNPKENSVARILEEMQSKLPVAIFIHASTMAMMKVIQDRFTRCLHRLLHVICPLHQHHHCSASPRWTGCLSKLHNKTSQTVLQYLSQTPSHQKKNIMPGGGLPELLCALLLEDLDLEVMSFEVERLLKRFQNCMYEYIMIVLENNGIPYATGWDYIHECLVYLKGWMSLEKKDSSELLQPTRLIDLDGKHQILDVVSIKMDAFSCTISTARTM